jgi:SHS family lactate transporter-like MFS transporter
MKESEVMVQYKKQVEEKDMKIRKVPLLDVFKDKRKTRILIISAIVLWLSQLVYHNLTDFGPLYIELITNSKSFAQTMVLVTGLFGAIGIIFFGGLSDKIGRKKAFLISAVLELGTIFFFSITTFLGLVSGIILAYLIFGFAQGHSGIYGVWLTEMFSTGERASTASTVYSFARGFSLSGIIVGIYSDFLISTGTSQALSLGLAMGTALFFAIPLIILPWFLPETQNVEIKAFSEEPSPTKE